MHLSQRRTEWIYKPYEEKQARESGMKVTPIALIEARIALLEWLRFCLFDYHRFESQDIEEMALNTDRSGGATNDWKANQKSLPGDESRRIECSCGRPVLEAVVVDASDMIGLRFSSG